MQIFIKYYKRNLLKCVIFLFTQFRIFSTIFTYLTALQHKLLMPFFFSGFLSLRNIFLQTYWRNVMDEWWIILEESLKTVKHWKEKITYLFKTHFQQFCTNNSIIQLNGSLIFQNHLKVKLVNYLLCCLKKTIIKCKEICRR